MNLNTIAEVKRPASADEITQWRDGYAWLAGGTWLFSEPQVATDTLIDLDQFNWPALQSSRAGLDIAATCRIVELYRFAGPAEWRASPLVRECCNAFLASFKIWNAATVGGNICMSLPAGPMISLTVALEASYTLVAARRRPARPSARSISLPAITPTFSSRANCCAASSVPASALSKRFAFRHASLTHLGRSAALLIGTQQRRRSADHDHRGDAAAGPAPLRARAVRGGAAARDRGAHPVGRLFRRRAWLGGLQAPPHLLFLPSRFAPSWRQRERAHEAVRCESAAGRRSRQPHELHRQWQAVFRRAAARPVPAHLPARARRASASRRAATPAIAAPAPSGSTARRCIPA